MCSPAIFFSLIINMISAFGGVALIDRGLSYSQSLSPMESYITGTMFSSLNLGYASALAGSMFISWLMAWVTLYYPPLGPLLGPLSLRKMAIDEI